MYIGFLAVQHVLSIVNGDLFLRNNGDISSGWAAPAKFSNGAQQAASGSANSSTHPEAITIPAHLLPNEVPFHLRGIQLVFAHQVNGGSAEDMLSCCADTTAGKRIYDPAVILYAGNNASTAAVIFRAEDVIGLERYAFRCPCGIVESILRGKVCIAACLWMITASAHAQGIKDVFLHIIPELHTRNDLYPPCEDIMAQTVLPDAFTIAILAAIESLLSCVVADGMTNSRHRSNTELVAQGVGNIGSALFGGIPATGAIARTAANVKNGGRTPVAGMVHSITLLLILVVLMPYAALIPMPAIAAILFQVAYNMCQWRPFVHLVKTAPKSDISVLVLTFVLTIVFDLVVAIEIGLLLTCLLFMKRMSDETGVRSWLYVEEVEEQKRKEQEVRKAKKAGKELSVEEAQLLAAAAEDEEAAMKEQARLREIPRELAVYEITGPLFFGAADRINQIETREETKCLVLRMRAVPAVDSTAMNSMVALYERCQKNGVTLILSHVNEQPMHVMEKAGFVDMVGRDHFCPNIEAALDHADEVLGK